MAEINKKILHTCHAFLMRKEAIIRPTQRKNPEYAEVTSAGVSWGTLLIMATWNSMLTMYPPKMAATILLKRLQEPDKYSFFAGILDQVNGYTYYG